MRRRWKGTRHRIYSVVLLVWSAGGLLSGCQRDDATSEPAVSAGQAPIPIAVATPSPATVAPVAASAPPMEAPPPHAAACVAASTGVGARSVAVHRWTDSAGIVHYSDQPPPAAAKDARVIEVAGLTPITVQASGYDVGLPDQLEQRAVTDALGVQRVMHDVLGVATPAGVTLHIVFVRAAQTYAQLVGDPALAGSAGAYSTARQTIYVRMQPGDEANFAVLRHEITHALVHESIGNLPTPINEGLAEYFGRYRVGGSGGQIDLGAARQAMTAAAPDGDGDDALVDLLARSGDDFYAITTGTEARERRYLRAAALIALLMRDEPGRAALAGILAAQRADACHPVAAEKLLDAHYPDGLRGLAKNWAAYMRAPPNDVVAY